MTIYRIYSRYQHGGPWSPVCVGDYGYTPREWTDLGECREAFNRMVENEKADRAKYAKPEPGVWVSMFSPKQYKIVSVPTVDIEVFDAPYSPPAEPHHRHPRRADAAAGPAQPDPGTGTIEYREA